MGSPGPAEGELRKACGGPGPETGPPDGCRRMSVPPRVLGMFCTRHAQSPQGTWGLRAPGS